MRRKLVRMARGAGLQLRQSYARVSKTMLVGVMRSARGRHAKGIRKYTKKLKTYLARISHSPTNQRPLANA